VSRFYLASEDDFDDWPDPDPDPEAEPLEEPEGWQALTAAERNPSLCRQ
jgi:hypothetical protein